MATVFLKNRLKYCKRLEHLPAAYCLREPRICWKLILGNVTSLTLPAPGLHRWLRLRVDLAFPLEYF